MKTQYTKEEKIAYFKELLEREKHKNVLISAKAILSDEKIKNLENIIKSLEK